MFGFGHIGEFAFGFIHLDLTVVYEPVSRILSGGTFQAPASVPTVLEGVNWDDGTIILWDDNTPIYWDA